MKITAQKELDDLIATVDKSNTRIVLNEDLEITFGCIIPFNIKVYGNIKAQDIDAYGNIKAQDINACNIRAWNIKAHDINAHNIKAQNIDAKNIKYYAFCIAYESLRYKSISGRRKNSFHKCLDREIETIKN